MLVFHYIALFVLVLIGTVYADEIVLDNGDRLTGTVVKSAEGVLTLKPDYSNPVDLQISRIKKISTDSPVEIRMSTGEIIKGKLSVTEDGTLAVETPTQAGKALLDWKNIEALNPPPEVWHGNINIGATQQGGNTERTSISVSGEAVRKTKTDRFSLRLLHNYAEEKNEVTARNTYGALKYDYFFTKRAFAYLGIEMLNDKFKNLNLRTIIGPGVGYQIWDDSIKSLQVEGGVSYFSEDLVEGTDHQWATARLTANASYKLMNTVVFSDYLLFYPKLEDSEGTQSILRNEAAIASALGAGWSMRLANIYEHSDNPPVGIKNDDTYWILGLQYTF